MSSKVKRKVTVENNKDGEDQPRRPSVFERLGPGAVNITTQPTDRHNRQEQNEKCRNWLRTGTCAYGNTCRYQHDPFPGSSRRNTKSEKEMDEKDLRHKVRSKRDEPKESRTGSVSPKRKGSKRSNSRSRKGEHESKIKSTVVVTRPRSPSGTTTDAPEPKKKSDGNWEDDSDDWPMDAAQLDYKEELTLERKRQQLQRELELELQKERLLNENVTITKTISFSESSSSSSSSDSGSISSSSESSSSSSDDDSDESSSSSSSSSSSGSRAPTKRKSKKSSSMKDSISDKNLDVKPRDDYDKIKSSRASKAQKHRSPSPPFEGRSSKKGRDKRKVSPLSPKRRFPESRSASGGRSSLNIRIRGPRTPSPVVSSRKQRQWAQSSSADSRSADVQRSRGKRHKKKKDVPKSEKYKHDRGPPTPPPLSSPNRTALMPIMQSSKKSKQRDDSVGKGKHRNRDASPLLLSRNSGSSVQSVKLLGSHRYLAEEKAADKHRSDDRSKLYSRKDADELLPLHKRTDSRERGGKRSRLSPRKDNRKGSISPHKDRYESDLLSNVSRKMYISSVPDKEEKSDRHRTSISPTRSERRKGVSEMEKKREIREVSPRLHDSRRDNQYRSNDYEKRGNELKVKRLLSPDTKKGREDRNRDHSQKDRNIDYESNLWSADHRKPNASSTGHRTPELRGRQDVIPQSSLSRNERSRERDPDRKKRKDRDLSVRSVEDPERARLSPSRRSPSPIHGHHTVREIESLTGNRGRIYDSEIPPGERDYVYGYDPLHDPYMNERLLPSDYDPDVIRGPSLYPSDVYPDTRYRRDVKEPGAILDRYSSRDVVSPREILPHRDIISLTGRNEDYLPDIPIDDRSYDERWPRGRGRDDWDTYPAVTPATLPPHVAASLDEDRYGMPRRRRASPDWQRGRLDDRDPSMGPLNHRQLGRGEGRSRSPPKGPGGNRGSWGERGGRHDNRTVENRHDDSQKSLEDRKTRNVRKDRGKRKEEIPEVKLPPAAKATGKRTHSTSPPVKDVKRRKEDIQTPEITSSDKGSMSSYKRLKEEFKEVKLLSRSQKSAKSEVSSPMSDLSHNSLVSQDKVEVPVRNETKAKEREERKSRHNEDGMRDDDDFSDWSDGDDELLNRDDFAESEANNENLKVRHKADEKVDDGSFGNSRRREKYSKEDTKKIKETSSCTNSKDRSNDELVHSKDKAVSEGKETDTRDTLLLKDDAATDVDEYITAESVDYDPISDDEDDLDALIEEPDESLMKTENENEKSKAVDALDVDWSALITETKKQFVPGFARQRFKAAHVLSRIGFSQVLAGPELSEKIINICQKQLKEEEQNDGNADNGEKKEEKKFVMEHQLAAFHVAISQNKKERVNIFKQVGPYRRALCARRDLQIRKLLCKPINKFTASSTVTYSPQYSVVDKDLYKQSLEFLKLKKPAEPQPQTVDVC
ncbi:zinc finger CCCH domain-containing protein 13-like isoform X2 [Stegodyphus dumicola]|uniref:zinc finger CCCH domain-containing protein 13-like isoform X2 n=1 Tax=Stegodyphus dumicola TaxID=202533 RepID=UPI0015AE08A0|nr:zinc finger CCCH domain-containing protein 13-like isoform X2 [Stegodyphus dumicola]